jgi:hypothetical protein
MKQVRLQGLPFQPTILAKIPLLMPQFKTRQKVLTSAYPRCSPAKPLRDRSPAPPGQRLPAPPGERNTGEFRRIGDEALLTDQLELSPAPDRARRKRRCERLPV